MFINRELNIYQETHNENNNKPKTTHFDKLFQRNK